ncbi:MAG: hypothetical protein ACT4QD_25825 [Acidobacteriota bacterium]
MPATVLSQGAPPPLYRVFLADGSALASFGEWARVDEHIIFSMPRAAGAGPADLHLVSLPVQRVDLARTERYARAVRAATYAANRGEADFARLSAEVAQVLNRVALLTDPAARLAAAESARRSLADWPGGHFGFRSTEVREILGVLDEVIASLRAAAGLGHFDLALTARTAEPPPEPLLEAPDNGDVVRQLMAASAAVTTPAERVSLLQSVVELIDRAIDALPSGVAATIRNTALGGIAEVRKIDGAYTRLRTSILAEAARHAARADVRGLERLQRRVRDEDTRLGARRPDDVAGMVATLAAHLDVAHRLRLAHDQWLLRADGLRTYQRSVETHLRVLDASHASLDDIRTLAGPPPHQLRPLAQRLSRASRHLGLVKPPPELASVHALFRSAYELAENAVQLRLDAARVADVDLARQAASAASGAIMLMARARTDLEEALQPPTLAVAPATKQP